MVADRFGVMHYEFRERVAFALALISLFLWQAGCAGATGMVGGGADGNWPRWRGPEGTGVAPDATPPLQWSETQNVHWKVPIPGRGHSTPVIWGDRIYLTTAIATAETPADKIERKHQGIPADSFQEFTVMALDRDTGKEVWRRVARRAVPPSGTHPDGTWASGSPVTDGEVVVADFGSSGVYCYTVAGELLWEHDLGDMNTHGGFGEGSSPALYGETVIVLFDHAGESSITAYDRTSGAELWHQSRDESASWSTPLVIEVDGRPQVVTNGGQRVRAYDLESGELIWECAGMTGNATATPVYADSILYASTNFRGAAVQAIRPAGARGDITGTDAVVWTHDRDTSYVPSPLLYGKLLYLLKKHNGILTCFAAADGRVVYGPERLPGLDTVHASPVGAADRVYITGRDGTVLVLRHGDQFEILATNQLEDELYASPVFIGDRMYLRGSSHLYCIAGD